MSGFVWVDLFFGFMIAMLAAVPRTAVRKFLAVALVGGFGQSIFITGMMVSVLGWWKFNHAGIFSLDGVPVFIAMAWSPVLVIYAHFLSHLSKKWEIYTYFAAFSLGTTLFVHWLVRAGFLFFIHWSDLLTLLMAVLLFSPVTYFLVRYRADITLSPEDKNR